MVFEFNPPDNIMFLYLNVDGDENGTEFRCSLFSQVSNTGLLDIVAR